MALLLFVASCQQVTLLLLLLLLERLQLGIVVGSQEVSLLLVSTAHLVGLLLTVVVDQLTEA